jgi:hypothetical protein
MPFTQGWQKPNARVTAEPVLDLRPIVGNPARACLAFAQPGTPYRRFYPRLTKVLPCIPLIVSATTQAKIVQSALAPHRKRLDVVQL